MRSLRVTLYTDSAITLPLAYNELVQGVLYSCWRKHFPELHDSGFGGVDGFKPFTFGRLEGKNHINSKSRTIRFFDTVSFDVRSPMEELIDDLAAQLADRGQVRIGAYELTLTNLEGRDRLLYPKRCMVSLCTPVVACQTLDGGHAQFLSPADEGWLEKIQANAVRKAQLLGLNNPSDLQIIPLEETLRKQVTKFKGTFVTGWKGELVMAASPELMMALWCLGLGSKNSQGFGIFDILDKPL